jgi:hypothetical protein
MRRQTPIQSLVYNTLFPDPTPQDPQDFSQFLIRYLILEVRVETHRFYGNLDTIEAKYPGLNYAHAPHRRRLGRFPHHARLFRAFDALGLTAYEIAELCKWEGTLWARQRYEREENIRVEDTTGNEIPRWKPRELYYRRGNGSGRSRSRPLSPPVQQQQQKLQQIRSVSPRERRVSYAADEREKASSCCNSPTIGGRKRKRIAGNGGSSSTNHSLISRSSRSRSRSNSSESEGQDVGADNNSFFAGEEMSQRGGFTSEIEEEILNVYRQRPAPFATPFPPSLQHQQHIHAMRPSLSLNTAIVGINGTERTLFYGTSTNRFTGRRSSTTTGVPFPHHSQSQSHIQNMMREADIVSEIGNGLTMSNATATTSQISNSTDSISSNSTTTFINITASNSPPQLTMDEETASETASIMTEDIMTLDTEESKVVTGINDTPLRIGLLNAGEACGNGGMRMSLPTPPTSAPRETLQNMMMSPTALHVDGIVASKVDTQTGLPSPVASSDGDAEML